MAYFEIINEVLNNNQNVYAYIYNDGDNEGDEVLQVEDWEEVKELNSLLKVALSEVEDYEDIVDDTDDKWGTNYIDFATDNNWVFSDESFVCNNCGRLHRNDNNYVNYFFDEEACELYCDECVREEPSIMKRYIETLINNPRHANIILSEEDLINNGFNPMGEEYAHGWYGRVDNPERIYNDIINEHPEAEVVFSVEKTYNPWETSFKAFVRITSEEE